MSKVVSTRDVYGETLVKLGEEHEEIVALDCDLSSSTRSALFGNKFPHRFFNMGVSEQDMMGTAAGLSTAGKVPFASTFAVFASGRAWEQIRMCICIPSLNVKVVGSHGGITVGEDGATHQATEDIAIMRALPNMTIVVPADAVETEQAVRAIYAHKGPVYLRLARNKYPVLFDENYRFEIGKANIIREGKDLAIIAAGYMVSKSLEAAQELREHGVEASVVNMSTIKPLDEECVIRVAREAGAVLTVEEHSIIGGLGSAVAETLAENHPVPMKRMGTGDKFGISGAPEELIEHYGLSGWHIVEEALKLVNRKGKAREAGFSGGS